MDPVLVNFNLVGRWNTKIFNPAWILNNLLEESDGQDLKGEVNAENLDITYNFGVIHLVPQDNSLKINIKKFDKESLARGARALNCIINLLPHTPISGIGYNVMFQVEGERSLSYINFLTSLPIYKDGAFRISRLDVSQIRDGYALNVVSELIENAAFSVSFNFHFSKIQKRFDEELFYELYLEAKEFISTI
jgi:hypothetical protein